MYCPSFSHCFTLVVVILLDKKDVTSCSLLICSIFPLPLCVIVFICIMSIALGSVTFCVYRFLLFLTSQCVLVVSCPSKTLAIFRKLFSRFTKLPHLKLGIIFLFNNSVKYDETSTIRLNCQIIFIDAKLPVMAL